MAIFCKLPYVSALKPGLYTCKGSNIHRVVQHNERNKHLGSLKCPGEKLLDIKVALYIKENKLILRGPQCEKMMYEILNLHGFTQD